MRAVKINEAEAIIEPFWDGGTSDFEDKTPRYRVWKEYRTAILNGAQVKSRQDWAFVTIQLEKGEAGREFFTMERECSISISDYDTLILFASIPKMMFFSAEAIVDGHKVILGETVGGLGETGEFSLPLKGERLLGLKLTFGSQSPDGVLNLGWLGLSDSARVEKMLASQSPYSQEWPGFFKDQEEAVLSPQIGLLFDGEELEEIREKMKHPLFRDIYDKKRRKALEDSRIAPERYIGRNVPYLDRRWSRGREREDVKMPVIMENMAFVALVEKDYDLMRTACRFAISAAHCEYWCESVMGIFPGATWHHRSFTENAYCKACALVLDWGGGLLTPHARQVIRDALVMKGLPRIESDFRRMEYIRHMNQGVVFSEGRIFAYLALLPVYPRYLSNLEEAQRDVCEIIQDYIREDGGTPEGPSYWMFTFREIMPAFYALARQKKVPFSHYRELFSETGKFALSMLSMEDEGTQILPVNDAHPGVHMASSLAHSFYVFTGEERWSRLYRRLFRKGLMDEDTFSLIVSPAGDDDKEEQPEEEKETGRLFPVTGQLGSLRKGKSLTTHIHLCSGNAYRGHYHQDKGSLILEADGKTLCPDCGSGYYYDSDLFSLSYPCAHSLLLPVWDNGKMAVQDPALPGGKVLEAWEKGSGMCFWTKETDSWETGAYRKIERRIYSPVPELIFIEDIYELEEADYTEFLLNSYTPFRLEDQEAVTQNGEIILSVIPVNWKWERAALSRLEDGEHRSVWQLHGKAPERKGRLVTALVLSKKGENPPDFRDFLTEEEFV